MGTWGTAIFSDDLACDVRDQYREEIANGASIEEAVRTLKAEYASSLIDHDEMYVFWFSLAATAWKIGRLNCEIKDQALSMILAGGDLQRWDELSLRNKREKHLCKLAELLQSPQPKPVTLRKRVIRENDWKIGELVSLRLKSDRWALLHVVDHHIDKGGKMPICQLLNWIGTTKPTDGKSVDRCEIIQPLDTYNSSEFIFEEPTTKADKLRIERWGLFRAKRSFLQQLFAPQQNARGMERPIILWSHCDELLQKLYGVS